MLRLKSCGLGEGGGRALAEALRLNSTLKSLDIRLNDMGEGGGRALAETLRLNTRITSLNLWNNDLREEVQSALGQAWGDRGFLRLWQRLANQPRKG